MQRALTRVHLATVNIEEYGATLRLEAGCYMGRMLWPLVASLLRIQVPGTCQRCWQWLILISTVSRRELEATIPHLAHMQRLEARRIFFLHIKLLPVGPVVRADSRHEAAQE